MLCFFASDLHGREAKYHKLFAAIRRERPAAVFLGGDLLPTHLRLRAAAGGRAPHEFITEFLAVEFLAIRAELGEAAPRVFIILGNDDGRFEEPTIVDAAAQGAWEYVHGRRVEWGELAVYGYAYVPPTPFLLKDWERYDVSRSVDPGCISPEEGRRTVMVSEDEARYSTIQDDLVKLAGDADLSKSIFLFHSPPYDCLLDRAPLDGTMVDHAPLDPHVGSIAIRRFIESRRPLLTLHGHVHESTRLTGAWRERFGSTHAFNGSHDGPELSLIRFDPARLDDATRELI
jgi:Icc-related predicted phosphoesterase